MTMSYYNEDQKLPSSIISSVKTENLVTLQNKTYTDFSQVDYINDPLSYEEFFEKYLLPNKLCIIGPWLTKDWQSRKEWVTEDGRPHVEYLTQQFGDALCPVANCQKEECGSHVKAEMKFNEFMDYMKRYKESGYSDDMDCLYLKDWHFIRSFPDYKVYTTPAFFTSDWLNEFWDQRSDTACDDYRFVYIGPKGSWTPFHSDVLRSYSWSANICGKKKWIFFPPGEEEYLKDINGHLPYDLRSPELENRKKYPNIDKITKRFELIQNTGEVIFVPSGWHHQVFNMEDTISINHNWMNGCNIDICWRFLTLSLSEVKQEISDCCDMDGWDKQCQLILKSTTGIDYLEFYKYIELIANNRMRLLRANVTADKKIRNVLHSKYLCDESENKTKVNQAVDEVLSYLTSHNTDCTHEPPVVPSQLVDRFQMFNSAPDEPANSSVISQVVEICCHAVREFTWAYTQCREYYGWHFPELQSCVKDRLNYARVVKLLGFRSNAATCDLSGVLSSGEVEQVRFCARMSMGAEVNEDFIEKSQGLCDQVIDVGEYQKQMHGYLKTVMSEVAPVLSSLIGELEGAKLMAFAESMLSEEGSIKGHEKVSNISSQDQNDRCCKVELDQSELHEPTVMTELNLSKSDETTVKNELGMSKLQVSTVMNELELSKSKEAKMKNEQVQSTVKCELNLSLSDTPKAKMELKTEKSPEPSIKSELDLSKLQNPVKFEKANPCTKDPNCTKANNDMTEKIKTCHFNSENSSNSVKNHFIFDLKQLESVISSMLKDSDFQSVIRTNCDTLNPCSLLQKINYCFYI